MAATFAASHQSTIGIPFGAPDYVAHAVNYAVLGALPNTRKAPACC
jgi:hypothetical protein